MILGYLNIFRIGAILIVSMMPLLHEIAFGQEVDLEKKTGFTSRSELKEERRTFGARANLTLGLLPLTAVGAGAALEIPLGQHHLLEAEFHETMIVMGGTNLTTMNIAYKYIGKWGFYGKTGIGRSEIRSSRYRREPCLASAEPVTDESNGSDGEDTSENTPYCEMVRRPDLTSSSISSPIGLGWRHEMPVSSVVPSSLVFDLEFVSVDLPVHRLSGPEDAYNFRLATVGFGLQF